MTWCPIFHFTSKIETVGFAFPSSRIHCWSLESPSSSFAAVLGEHCRMSLLCCQQPLLHWGFHSHHHRAGACLQHMPGYRHQGCTGEAEELAWSTGVEQLAWNSQAERQKAEASQQSTAEPYLQTSPTFQDRWRALMHRTKHSLAPHCLEQELHPSRPLSTSPAAGRAGSATGITQGWQDLAMSLASPHLAPAADLSLGVTRLHCQERQFWNGEEGKKEEWHTSTLSWESSAEPATFH